jgi:pimeloyl-ACP methyl ester carboxylesterase
MGTREYWRTLIANAADVPLGMETIECPVTLAQGAADWLSGTQTIRYARAIPGATMSWLPFAGHAAQGDAPRAVVALMRETAARAAHVSA